ncbi:MAG: tripartite tricarboxylate transporter substrate binding protein [Sheuella sp.]|nr:tripartite tricarboxylate transporter substrate binding protein [Sheuella sp.]
MKKTLLTAAITLTASLFSLSAQAAEPFPTKSIQVVIPFAPGDTDNMLRPFLDKMGEFLGQPVLLTYKAGAGGGVGAGTVATSKPDGYTLVGTSQGSIVVVPLFNKEVKYTTESFAPIASLSEGGFMLLVRSDSQWKNLKELIDYSKQNPKKINFTTSGAMGVTHLLAEIFANEAGVQWTHIPEKGSGPAVTALLGGHVEMTSSAVAPALSHIRAGTLRPLATFGENRLKAFPDVPTFKELGYKIASPGYYGILAPAGTPPEVVDAIYQAAKKATDKYQKQIGENLGGFGAEIKLLPPKEYAEYIASQKKLFSDAKKNLDLKQ